MHVALFITCLTDQFYPHVGVAVTKILDKVLKVDFSRFKLPAGESITYHYACHLRGIGVKDEGVKLLQQIGGVDFKPMEKTDQCCGFGGTFAVKYPAISGAIVEDKTRCIAATGAGTTVV